MHVHILSFARHLQSLTPPSAVTEPYTRFFQVNLKCQRTHRLPRKTTLVTYLLTLQANCAKEKHNADAITADHYFCLFSEKCWKKC